MKKNGEFSCVFLVSNLSKKLKYKNFYDTFLVNCYISRPVAVELPYYANVLENNRQLVVLRSNDGETWKPHDSPCSDQEFRNQFKEEGKLEEN